MWFCMVHTTYINNRNLCMDLFLRGEICKFSVAYVWFGSNYLTFKTVLAFISILN